MLECSMLYFNEGLYCNATAGLRRVVKAVHFVALLRGSAVNSKNLPRKWHYDQQASFFPNAKFAKKEVPCSCKPWPAPSYE